MDKKIGNKETGNGSKTQTVQKVGITSNAQIFKLCPPCLGLSLPVAPRKYQRYILVSS